MAACSDSIKYSEIEYSKKKGLLRDNTSEVLFDLFYTGIIKIF